MNFEAVYKYLEHEYDIDDSGMPTDPEFYIVKEIKKIEKEFRELMIKLAQETELRIKAEKVSNFMLAMYGFKYMRIIAHRL